MSNVQIAKKIFADNISADRKDVIEMILNATTLSPTDARVYYRRIELEHFPERARKATKTPKATKVVEVTPETKIINVPVVKEITEHHFEIDESVVPEFLMKSWMKFR